MMDKAISINCVMKYMLIPSSSLKRKSYDG